MDEKTMKKQEVERRTDVAIRRLEAFAKKLEKRADEVRNTIEWLKEARQKKSFWDIRCAFDWACDHGVFSAITYKNIWNTLKWYRKLFSVIKELDEE